MAGAERVPVPVIDAGVVLRYADGHTETAMLGAGKVLGWLGKMRVYPPARYAHERPVESLTDAELAHCRTLYRQGTSWRELGEIYGVPEKELRSAVMARKPATRTIAREKMRERDMRIIDLKRQGFRQCVIAERMGVTDSLVSQVLRRWRSGYYDA